MHICICIYAYMLMRKKSAKVHIYIYIYIYAREKKRAKRAPGCTYSNAHEKRAPGFLAAAREIPESRYQTFVGDNGDTGRVDVSVHFRTVWYSGAFGALVQHRMVRQSE